MTKYSDKTHGFFADVYDVVKLLPKGRVTSYGAVAKYLGSGRSSRMVGWAMSASATMDDIPAHRVVNRLGVLSGKMHFSTPFAMQEALEREGIEVKDDQIVDFEKYFWNPALELEI